MRFRQDFLPIYVTPVPTLCCYFITPSRLIHFFGDKNWIFLVRTYMEYVCKQHSWCLSTSRTWSDTSHDPVSISNKVPQAWPHSTLRPEILSLGAAVYSWSKQYAYRQLLPRQSGNCYPASYNWIWLKRRRQYHWWWVLSPNCAM